MALTEVVRLRLEAIGFSKTFDANRVQWVRDATAARELMHSSIAQPTIDDIKKAFAPLIEIDPNLKKFLSENKLTQKYWVDNCADYILHRIYAPTLDLGTQGGQAHGHRV